MSNDPFAPAFCEAAGELLARWKDELGFASGPIWVRRFSVDGIRITDRPRHLDEFARDPERDEPDPRKRSRPAGRGRALGPERKFVLNRGKPCWLNADGGIHST